MTKQLLLIFIFLFSVYGNSSAEKVVTPISAIPPQGTFNLMKNITLPKNFDIQGHRGARGLKAENTLPAFEVALDLGVSTLEMDLHYTSDQQVVIWHDDTLSPDKCRPKSNALISQLTLKQLKQFSCVNNPDVKRFPFQQNLSTSIAENNYKIQTLDELFEFVNQYANSPKKSKVQQENAKHIRFNIETKRNHNFPEGINDGFDGINPGNFELAILKTIKKYNLEHRTIIQSFDHRSLWSIRSVNSTIELSALSNNSKIDLQSLSVAGATIWSPNYQKLTSALVDEAHKVQLKVIPWTINDPLVMRKMIKIGVDGIITDRPDLLLLLNDEKSYE